jgi:hypothetical protein
MTHVPAHIASNFLTITAFLRSLPNSLTKDFSEK